jgi:hypothetical protein
MRAVASLMSIVVAMLAQGTPTFAETLYCSTWQGVRTCSSPDGYTSHETQWQGRTNGWDNRGNARSTCRWEGFDTTTVEPHRPDLSH